MIFTRAPSPPTWDLQAQRLDLPQLYIFYTQPALVAQQTSFNPRMNKDVNENTALTEAKLPYAGQSSKPDNQHVGSTQLGRAGVKA